MTVLIVAVDAAGEVTGQCDARCYLARWRRCKCVCGGVNHGKGREQAEANAREMDFTGAKVTVTGARVSRIRLGAAAATVPLFDLTPQPRPAKGPAMTTPPPIPQGTAVWYHGRRDPDAAGPSPIMVEDAAGAILGQVAHIARHSTTGMSWGFAGSGPADCARSLLLAAAGPEGNCHDCLGTGRTVYDRETDADAGPFDPALQDEYARRGLAVATCGGYPCDSGSRVTPAIYQDFKFEFVAAWGDDWRMSRDQVMGWLRPRLAAASA